MSYDIKGYVSVRNNEEKRNGIFSATTLKMPYGATVQIPHMVLDVVEKMEEIDGSELKITFYIRKSEKIGYNGIIKNWKEIQKRKV